MAGPSSWFQNPLRFLGTSQPEGNARDESSESDDWSDIENVLEDETTPGTPEEASPEPQVDSGQPLSELRVRGVMNLRLPLRSRTGGEGDRPLSPDALLLAQRAAGQQEQLLQEDLDAFQRQEGLQQQLEQRETWRGWMARMAVKGLGFIVDPLLAFLVFSFVRYVMESNFELHQHGPTGFC